MGMEPLRVLELYSGIGGMHQALRGERGPGASLFARRRGSELGLLGGAERRDARGGDWGGGGREAGRLGGWGWCAWLSWKPSGVATQLASSGGNCFPQAASLVRRATRALTQTQSVSPDPPGVAVKSNRDGTDRGGGASPPPPPIPRIASPQF